MHVAASAPSAEGRTPVACPSQRYSTRGTASRSAATPIKPPSTIATNFTRPLRRANMAPRLAQPGRRMEYGLSMDRAGGITGNRAGLTALFMRLLAGSPIPRAEPLSACKDPIQRKKGMSEENRTTDTAGNRTHAGTDDTDAFAFLLIHEAQQGCRDATYEPSQFPATVPYPSPHRATLACGFWCT